MDKAVEVTHCAPPAHSGRPQGEPQHFDGYTKTLLVSCELFTSHRLEISTQAMLAVDEASFVSLLALEGEGTLTACGQMLPFQKGESVFLPAGSGEYRLSGAMTVLETRV